MANRIPLAINQLTTYSKHHLDMASAGLIWGPTDTPAEEAAKKALEACQAALEAENHANAAEKVAHEGKVELAQQEAQAAKELATKAENAYLADKSGGA